MATAKKCLRFSARRPTEKRSHHGTRRTLFTLASPIAFHLRGKKLLVEASDVVDERVVSDHQPLVLEMRNGK